MVCEPGATSIPSPTEDANSMLTISNINNGANNNNNNGIPQAPLLVPASPIVNGRWNVDTLFEGCRLRVEMTSSRQMSKH